MENPTTTKGMANANKKQNGIEVHSLSANLSPNGLGLRVASPNKWVILATVLLLIGGCIGIVATLALILR